MESSVVIYPRMTRIGVFILCTNANVFYIFEPFLIMGHSYLSTLNECTTHTHLVGGDVNGNKPTDSVHLNLLAHSL